MTALAAEAVQGMPVEAAAPAQVVDRHLAHVRRGVWHAHWEGFSLMLDNRGFGKPSKIMGLAA